MADYLYSSARVRALETRLIGRERIWLLPEEHSAADVWRRLTEYGVEPICDANGRIDTEESLLCILKNAYDTVCEMLPNDPAVQLWLYPYDCNNVKAAIKCFARGIDPRPMTFDFGTLAAERVIEMVKCGSFEGLPPHMLQAAAEATEAYAKTKNPQAVDLCMDRACYADMIEAAGQGFCLELVKRKLDLVNLISLIRVMRMRCGEMGERLLEAAWLSGGSFDEAFLHERYHATEDELWQILKGGAFAGFAHRLDAKASLTAIERQADDFWMDLLKTVKFVPYGAEVVVAYLLATECEVRNLRIVLAGQETGLPAATVRERIRDGYV